MPLLRSAPSPPETLSPPSTDLLPHRPPFLFLFICLVAPLSLPSTAATFSLSPSPLSPLLEGFTLCFLSPRSQGFFAPTSISLSFSSLSPLLPSLSATSLTLSTGNIPPSRPLSALSSASPVRIRSELNFWRMFPLSLIPHLFPSPPCPLSPASRLDDSSALTRSYIPQSLPLNLSLSFHFPLFS